MMAGRDGPEPQSLRPTGQLAIAPGPRLLLQGGRGFLGPIESERRVRYAQRLANAGNEFGFGFGLRAKPVIYRRRLNPPLASGRSEQQQCEAIGTAGDRDAERCISRQQAIEVRREPADQRRIRNSWRPPCPC